MNTREKSDDILFMSTGLFEHLNDAESYVFSHVAFFACQRATKYQGLFKQTTRAICNKVGYSPNTVRKALESLIKKKFLSEVALEDKSTLKYNYIEKVAHRLTIGEASYALQFSGAMQKMLTETGKKKAFKSVGREMTFFRVNVGKLRRHSDDILSKKDKNLSKHLHKTLIMHGYLHNQTSWNDKRGKSHLSRGVSYLSALMQWSQNTVRRVINTLKDIGAIAYSYAMKTVTFTFVSLIQSIKKASIKLSTSLTSVQIETPKQPLLTPPKNVVTSNPSSADAIAYLNSLRNPA
jgi:transcription initiation factor IIE alpha subunit